MRVQTRDGRIVEVPDNLSPQEQLALVRQKTAPPPPPPPDLTYGERFAGHLTKGAGELFSTAGNILALIPGAHDNILQETGADIKGTAAAQKVIQQPPQGFWPNVGWSLLEFAPQMPLYFGGEALPMAGMKAVPYLRAIPKALEAVKGGAYIPEIPKAMGRAAIAGATVGTLGAEPGSGVAGSLRHGAEEAVGFAGAVGAFGTLFRILGAGGRGLIRAHMDKIARMDKARVDKLVEDLQAEPNMEARHARFAAEMDAWGRELPEFSADTRLREEPFEPFRPPPSGEPPKPPPAPPAAPTGGGEPPSVQNLKVAEEVKTDVKEDLTRVDRVEREGEEARRSVQDEGPGEEAPSAGGVLQAQEGVVPKHGTDIDALEGILSEGLRPGSALDITPEALWATESPIVIDVPGVQLGEFVAHNKYYKSSSVGKPTRVTVDFEQYTDEGIKDVKAKIDALMKKHPDVEFILKNYREQAPITEATYIKAEQDFWKAQKEHDALQPDPKIEANRKAIAEIRDQYRNENGIVSNMPEAATKAVRQLESEANKLERKFMAQSKRIAERMEEAYGRMEEAQEFAPKTKSAPPAPKEATPKKAFLSAKTRANKAGEMFEELEWFEKNRLYDHLELLERGYPLERIKVAEGFERTGPTVLEMTKSEAKAELQKLYDIKVEPPTEHELLAWQERLKKIQEARPEAGKHRNIGMTASERKVAKTIADRLKASDAGMSALRALGKILRERQLAGKEEIELGNEWTELTQQPTPTPPKASPVRQVEVTPELEAQYLASLAKKEEQTAARELLRKGKGESKIGKLPERIREETPEEVEARVNRRRRRTKKEETEPVTEDEVKKVQAEIDKIAAEEEAGREIKAPKEAEKVDVDVDPNSAEAWERRLSDEGMGVEEGAVDKFMEEEVYNPLWRDERGFIDITPLAQVYERAVETLRKVPEHAESLNRIARGIIVEGKKAFADFKARFKEVVGDLWEGLKARVRELWKSATEWYKNSRIGSERGSFSTEAKEPSETMANFRRGLHKFSDEARAWYETSVFGKRPQRDINTLRDVATLMEEKAYEVPKPAAKVIESLSGEKAKVYDIRNENGPDIVKGSEWIVPTMRTFSSHPGADRAAFEVVAADLTAGHNRGIHFSVIGNAVAGLKEEERKLLRDVIEKGKFAPEHIRQAALKISAWLGHMKTRYKAFLTDMYMKHLSEGEMRAVQDVLAGGEVEAVAKGAGMKATTLQSLVNKLNEIDSWGLDPDTYLPRVERGSIKIMERSKDGKGYKVVAVAFSEEHAAEKIAKLLEERPRDLFLDHTMPEYLRDLPTPISPMRAKILNGKIQKAMKDELDKVNKELSKIMRGVYEVRPTKKYTPFEKPRHDVLKGEEDPVPVLFAYAHAMETKMQLDPVIDKVQALLPNLPENMRAAMTTLIEDIKGRRWMSDQVLEEIGKRFGISLEGRPFSRFVSNVKMAEAWMKFAYRPIAGVINGASALGHIWAKTGSKYLAEGLRFMRTEEGKRLLDSVRHLLGTDVVTEMSGKTHGKLHLYHPLGMFQMPEKVMRELAVCANYLLAKSKGLADPAAIEFAVRANWMQNFIYNMAALPRALRVPTGRLLGQFKPYLVQEINFISQLRGQEAVRYLAVMATLGGPIGYIATLRTLPILSMFPWWNDIEEYVNTHAPAASRGIGGLMGVDVTAPATFQFPTRWEEWAGPFLGDLVKVKREVLDPLARGEFLDGSEAARELTSQTIPIAKHWWTAVDQVLDKDGWVKDDRGRRIYHIGESPLDKAAFASKIVAGATDLELSMIRKHERFLKEEARVRARNKQAVVDEILDAVLDGDPITPEMTNVMAELNIKPGSLRRAMKFRMLDAQTRRYLMTEVAKRPDLLEEWPELQ